MPCVNDKTAARAAALFSEHQQRVFQRTDRLFAALMLVQWLACIGVALFISPRTWTGASSAVHVHVWAAVFLGGTIALFPVVLVLMAPGKAHTRHVVSVAQMLFSALLIHLTGGRIETHFHVFGSLAFLAFYRDWRVLVTASLVVITDHWLRGMYWPQSVFGVIVTSNWRWLEHLWWVTFENAFLILATRQGIAEMWEVASRQAAAEHANAELEREIAERKRIEAALADSEQWLRIVTDSVPVLIGYIDEDLRYQFINAAYEDWFGVRTSDIRGMHVRELLGEETFKYVNRSSSVYNTVKPFTSMRQRSCPTARFGILKCPIFLTGGVSNWRVFLLWFTTSQSEKELKNRCLKQTAERTIFSRCWGMNSGIRWGRFATPRMFCGSQRETTG